MCQFQRNLYKVELAQIREEKEISHEYIEKEEKTIQVQKSSGKQ